MTAGRLDLNALAVFAAVVEEKGFSAAARKLGLSKSAVSKFVAQLEDHIGARLLQRTTRRLALTDAGSALYDRCARIVAEVQEAEAAVNQLQTQPKGILRVSAPLAFGIRHLGEPLAAFMRLYPELHVDMQLSDSIVDLVEEGFDMAVRIARLTDSTLIAKKLCSMEPYCVAAPAYLQERGTPTHPRDLGAHNCLGYSYSASGDTWQLEQRGQPLPAHVHGSLRTNNGDLMVAAVRAGLGMAILPAFLVGADLRSGKLVEVLADFRPKSAGVYAVYPHSRHLSTKVRLFVDHLAAWFASPPWSRCEASGG